MAEAEACFRRLLTSRDVEHFASIDTGLRGHKARNNLARICFEQGRLAEAEAEWQAVVQEEPAFAPAWLSLGEIYLQQGRWQDLAGIVRRLQACASPGDAAILQARVHLAHKEYAEARRILEPLVVLTPAALYPHLILSHVLLQEGRDLEGAEQVLRKILRLDPNHFEAKHNLTLLLQQEIPSRKDESRKHEEETVA